MTRLALISIASSFLIASAGCSDDAESPGSDAAADSSAVDSTTGEAGLDAEADGAADAQPDAAPDAPPPDASPDASPDATADAMPDAPSGCGDQGKICGDDAPCMMPGLVCWNGVCVRDMGLCGGIAGARCPPSAPECLMYPGASGWPCVTEADRRCICNSPDGAMAFRMACAM